METYDYRVKTEDIEQIGIPLDSLTAKQLQNIAEAMEGIKQSEEEEYLAGAKAYFTNAILPVLQEYAKTTYSLLQIEENKKYQFVEVTLKNQHGFELTEQCNYMRNLLVLANHIEIGMEDGFVQLTFIFDQKEMRK